MFCAITGEIPEEPMVSSKSGYVFEKRAILKWLETNNNTCPVTQEPLTPEDLIKVQGNKSVRPRPVTATSVPGMLQLFQNEWDALMLETFSLKQQLDSVRQELSHALYQHDAACRVIARLIKERDEARSAMSHMPEQPSASADSMEVERISDEIKQKMLAKFTDLSKERKKREVSSTLATADDIKEYVMVSNHPLHKPSKPGVACLDIHPSQQKILTGGVDGTAVIFSKDEKKVSSTINAHTKRLTDVLFHPTQEIIFTTSLDKTAKLWKAADSGYSALHVVKEHNDAVVGCALQATGDYWVTASLDNTWAFHDIETSTCLVQISSEAGFSCVEFHPDGLILGTGKVDSIVNIWDIKAQKNVASFEGHKGKIMDLSFSQNGFYLATAAEDNSVKLWDLRKLKNFHAIELGEGFGLSAINWDYSGTYLAVAGSEVRIYMGKTLNHIASLSKHTNTVTGVQFGADATWLATCSMDKNLKIWGKKKK